MKLFKKILIANRGEIAIRVIKSAKKLGITTVAIYTDIEEDAFHVTQADEAYCIGTSDLLDSYLNINKIIELAKKTNSDAIHPGYGFLAENPEFVIACEKNDIVFIGPHKEAVKLVGNKIEARNLIQKIGVPIAEGKTGSKEELLKIAEKDIFPLLVKAAAGGGGKGMRIVRSKEELSEAIDNTTREAKSYFGDGTVFVEKFFEEPRHIEIQVLGDNFGNVIHFYERECSIQRRYQKIIEESPSVTLTQTVREEMGKAAVEIAKETNYNNAGTVEFLVDKDLNFYFLEMNTRIQVEHPVTEMVTGVDLVEQQILVAAGNELKIKQEDVKQTGHAIESRIYAENPANNYAPSPGKIILYKQPEENENIRLDSAINKATTIQPNFDPMISKLVVWEKNRDLAREKTYKALENYIIHGIDTNISFLKEIMQEEEYIKNDISTTYCDKNTEKIVQNIEKEKNEIPKYIPIFAFLIYDINKNQLQNNEKNTWDKIGFWRTTKQINFELEEKEYFVNINNINKNLYQLEFENKELKLELQTIEQNKISFKIAHTYYNVYISDFFKGHYFVDINNSIFKLKRLDILDQQAEFFSATAISAGDSNVALASLHGKIIKINAKKGDKVKKGDVLTIIEAMKMENNIIASKDAEIKSVEIQVGENVETDQLLFQFL